MSTSLFGSIGNLFHSAERSIEHAAKHVAHEVSHAEKSVAKTIHHVEKKAENVVKAVVHDTVNISRKAKQAYHSAERSIEHRAKHIAHEVVHAEKSVAKTIHHVEKKVEQAAKKVEKSLEHTAKHVAHEVAHTEKSVAKTVHHVEKKVEQAAKKVEKSLEHTAKHVAHEVAHTEKSIASTVHHIEKKMEQAAKKVETSVEHTAKHVAHEVVHAGKLVANTVHHVEEKVEQAAKKIETSVEHTAKHIANAVTHSEKQVAHTVKNSEQTVKQIKTALSKYKESMVAFGKGAGDAFVSDLTLNTVKNDSNNNHPVAYKVGELVGHAVSALEGTTEDAASLAEEAGGAILDTTGIGAIVGVPVGAFAAGEAIHGTSVATKGTSRLVQSGKDLYNLAVHNAGKTSKRIEEVADTTTKGTRIGAKEDSTVSDEVISDGSHITKEGQLKPNVNYRTGEYDYQYKTDELGRLKEFKADNLKLTERDNRLPHKSNTPGKEPGDHAGHLAADRFGGSPELDNLVSQSSNVNLSKYKKLENQWASALKDGKKVSVNVKVNYKDNDSRPKSFEVKYSIDGSIKKIVLKN